MPKGLQSIHVLFSIRDSWPFDLHRIARCFVIADCLVLMTSAICSYLHT